MIPSAFRIFFCWLIPFIVFSQSVASAPVTLDPSNWGFEEGNECVKCHTKTSAGLTEQWNQSKHAQRGMNCLDCHKADSSDNDAIEHEGFTIATIVSPKDCGRCHSAEEKQNSSSVHANAVSLIAERMPVMAGNLAGDAIIAAGCSQCHGSEVKVKGDGSLDTATWPNSGIGRINPDGSKGSCSSCHGRHSFSKAQARDPSSCMRCHSGPDSPDRAIYEASKHGMAFFAHKDKMNLDADKWVAGKDYTSAPTCVTCHMGAAGKLPSSHDVGIRNAWNLNTPVSEKQQLIVFEDGGKREIPHSQAAPARGEQYDKIDGQQGTVKMVVSADRRRKAMTMVCQECHGKNFAQSFMNQFDSVVELYNEKFGKPAQAIMAALYDKKLLTPTPFDEEIEFVYWELWHDEGARARHGAAMASPNHTWWEGMYLVSRNFYTKFLPAANALADADVKKIINETVNDQEEHHGWLRQPGRASSLLRPGYGNME
jgi:hypothetical protein